MKAAKPKVREFYYIGKVVKHSGVDAEVVGIFPDHIDVKFKDGSRGRINLN